MSDGLGGAGTGPSQSDRPQANASRQWGDGRLLGPRAGRDVSRPKASTIKPGSSTRDQIAKGQT